MRLRILTLCLICLGTFYTQAQQIKPEKGYSDYIGTTVAMLEDLKSRVTRSVRDLDLESTDYLLDDKANRIGAMILHLAATERYYQHFTLGKNAFSEADDPELWKTALSLGDKGREQLIGKPISYYLAIWDAVRKETLALLKTKDDKWFLKKVKSSNANNYWAWYHVMEHQANHMGQIRLIIKRIPK